MRVLAAETDGLISASLHQDLEAARIVQSRLFPRHLPHVRGVEYYGECRPAGKVGGDFFDFVALPENRLAVSVGDVSGHGIGAAIIMSGLQAVLRRLTTSGGRELTRAVEELNRDFCQICPDNFYSTLFYAHVDAPRRQLHYVSAGHEPALLVRKRTGGVQELENTGTVLGLTARSTYERRALSVEPGDVLVVFTDGITEAADRQGRELGQEGLLRVIQHCADARASDLVGGIMQETERFTSFLGPGDDRTVVVIRFTDASTKSMLAEDSIEVEVVAA